MRGITRSLRLAIGTGAVLLPAPAAFAQAPPANDTFAGATVISALPFTTTEDTTGATLDSADTAASTACATPSGFTFGNSVWFAYTPSSDQDLELNTSGSSYEVAGAVLTSTPASFTSVSCFLFSTTFHATQGTTYYIDLLDFGATSGGTLSVSLTPIIAPNPVLTVDSSGSFDAHTGTATVTGTASCSATAFGYLFGSLSQSVGRIYTISGYGSPMNPLICDGSPHPWSFVVMPSSGLFKGGHATASVQMYACTFICAFQQVTTTITLKG